MGKFCGMRPKVVRTPTGFSNVVLTFAGRVSLKEFLELLVSALQQDGVLKRLIRAQKYGRMANAYDYFGPDEEDIAMRRLAPASIRQAYNTVVESYNTATNNKGIAIASKQKELKDAIKICQDAILSAIAKDASIIIAVRLIPGGVGCRQPPPPLRKQPLHRRLRPLYGRPERFGTDERQRADFRSFR